TSFDRSAIDQVMDYALDLKNFHEGSHHRYVVPVLVSTHAKKSANRFKCSDDLVAEPLCSNGEDLREAIVLALGEIPEHGKLEAEAWSASGYRPTPTIVEAAQALYQGHTVDDISRSDAGAWNLSVTSACVAEIIETSKRAGLKSICFVTGVPGAGKTLAG